MTLWFYCQWKSGKGREGGAKQSRRGPHSGPQAREGQPREEGGRGHVLPTVEGVVPRQRVHHTHGVRKPKCARPRDGVSGAGSADWAGRMAEPPVRDE